MSRENFTWGAPRIRSELLLLGYHVAESTVAKYMPREQDNSPSQSWRTFLENHLKHTLSCDFLVVPTITFQRLFVFIILAHERRRVVHFAVTTRPTSDWTWQQIEEALSKEEIHSKYLLRDRDPVYGHDLGDRLRAVGVEQVRTARKSPWQNPFCERVIGTLRRECLDHVVVLGERHLTELLARYLRYYHESRCHLSLDRNAPLPRPVEPLSGGRVIAIPHVGGLHHRYTRAA